MNSQIRALIIDDEQNSQIVLAELLNRYCPEVEVLDFASNIAEAKDKIEKLEPDLIFLDIQMPNGSGFDLLKNVDSTKFQVIFVTSHHQYALNAFRFNALDYLLKPIEIKDLKESVKRCFRRKNDEGLQNFMDFMDESKTDKKLMLHHQNQVVLVPTSEIKWIKGEDNYCKISCSSGDEYVLSKTLKEIELYYSKSNKFIRVRREIVLNIDFIRSYSKSDPCIITLRDQTEIEVSRRKRTEILEALRRMNA